jgi:hypothetical protein
MIAHERTPQSQGWAKAFAAFMAGPIGRLARIVLGIVLIVVGLMVVEGGWGVVIAIVGLAPLAVGIGNVCLVAPLIGAPFRGRDAR